MKKTELALLYMPYASADVARRHLNNASAETGSCWRLSKLPAGRFGYIGSHRCRWS